jgi:hypothetical protein
MKRKQNGNFEGKTGQSTSQTVWEMETGTSTDKQKNLKTSGTHVGVTKQGLDMSAVNRTFLRLSLSLNEAEAKWKF